MKASASILIKKPVAETFEAFADVENRHIYLKNIIELKIDSALSQGKGVKWSESRQVNAAVAKGHLEIVAFTPPKSLTFETKSEGIIFKTRFNFQDATNGNTKVVVTIGGKPRGFLGGILNRFLSKNSDYMNQALKHELEDYKAEIEK